MTPPHQPDLQRAFLAWLDEARPRLAVAIHIRPSTSEMLEFSFALAGAVLAGALTTGGDLAVTAEWEGECWDFLFSEEVRPQTTPDGFVCSLCETQGKHRIFPNIEALWHDHLFDPFEQWINTKLAVARAVALYRTDNGGATWARLVSACDPTGSPTIMVPRNVSTTLIQPGSEFKLG
jgi:hypothetical protein